MKKWIPIIFVLLLAIGLGAAAFLSGRTIFLEDDVVGSTAGNLLNGGLFCEDEDKIYFSNPNDRGSLYVMDNNLKNYKLLHTDNVSYINVAGSYVFYARDNHKRKAVSGEFFNLNSVGLYRIRKKDGGDIKQLYDDPVGSLGVCGNYVYYQHYNADEGLYIHKVKIDGNEDVLLFKEDIEPVSFQDGKLYYTGEDKDHDIHYLNLSNDQITDVYKGNCYNVVASGEYLYFLSLSNKYAIGRMGLDGSDPVLIEDERCSFFNISPNGKYLFYQIDGGKHNRLCRMDLDTLESETIAEGDFNSIHVTSKYVFYKNFDTEQFYYMPIGGSQSSVFNPPNLSSKDK